MELDVSFPCHENQYLPCLKKELYLLGTALFLFIDDEAFPFLSDLSHVFLRHMKTPFIQSIFTEIAHQTNKYGGIKSNKFR
ncbi:hypothetical protein F6Y05_04125 [Bacillus megaterium]|nr:hypothetical protein [Priestia megaterium]